MTVNINDIRQRRNEAIKSMSVMMVRKLLLDDLERLIQEVERLHGNRHRPSGEENGWQVETYTARRKLKSGAVAEYEYQREWRWENGVKVVRHIKTGRNAGRNGHG